MQLHVWRLASIALALLAAMPARAAADAGTPLPPALSPAQSAAVEKLVHDYLLTHPDVVVQAIENAEASMKTQKEAEAKNALVAHRAELYQDPDSPILGNKQAPVTLIEFFDYRCPYCKAVAKRLEDAVAADPHLRIVMKEYPILSATSEFASRVALVAWRHGRYAEFYRAAFELPGGFDDAAVMGVARQIGLDPTTVKTEANAPEISAEIERNRALGKAIGVDGTPSFIAHNEVVPGALTDAELKALVAKAAG